jgi:hypothetical protein
MAEGGNHPYGSELLALLDADAAWRYRRTVVARYGDLPERLYSRTPPPTAARRPAHGDT